MLVWHGLSVAGYCNLLQHCNFECFHHLVWQLGHMLNCTDSQHMFLQSHYSIKKASAALGFGTENLILLNTDERFALFSACMQTVLQEIRWLCDLLCDFVFQRESHSCWFGSQSNRSQEKGEWIILSNFSFCCAMRNMHAVDFTCSYGNTYVCQSSKVISIRLMLLSAHMWCCSSLKYLSWK